MARRTKTLNDIHNQYMRIIRAYDGSSKSYKRAEKAGEIYMRYAKNIKGLKSVARDFQGAMKAYNRGDMKAFKEFADRANNIAVARNTYMGLSNG